VPEKGNGAGVGGLDVPRLDGLDQTAQDGGCLLDGRPGGALPGHLTIVVWPEWVRGDRAGPGHRSRGWVGPLMASCDLHRPEFQPYGPGFDLAAALRASDSASSAPMN
jgi:hypothetical protein